MKDKEGSLKMSSSIKGKFINDFSTIVLDHFGPSCLCSFSL